MFDLHPINTTKNFGKIVNKQLNSYIESKKLLSPSDTVYEDTDTIVTKHDNKKKVLGMFLDIAKPFDTVSAPLLMDKLES